MLPANVTVLRPTTLPDRFTAGTLLAACQDMPGDPEYGFTEGVPAYTMVYSVSDENIAFVLNSGHSAWGNTPGPPTSIERVTVRGVEGTLTTLAAHVAGGRALPPSYALSWRENGQSYSIKVNSARLMPEAIRAIAEGLTSVR